MSQDVIISLVLDLLPGIDIFGNIHYGNQCPVLINQGSNVQPPGRNLPIHLVLSFNLCYKGSSKARPFPISLKVLFFDESVFKPILAHPQHTDHLRRTENLRVFFPVFDNPKRKVYQFNNL